MNDNKTEICCYSYSLRKKEKGLTVGASGREDIVHGGVPIISSIATSHNVVIDNKDNVYRLNEKNEKTPLAKSAEEARKIVRSKGIVTKATNKTESIRD